jgi:hypothetical protein
MLLASITLLLSILFMMTFNAFNYWPMCEWAGLFCTDDAFSAAKPGWNRAGG